MRINTWSFLPNGKFSILDKPMDTELASVFALITAIKLLYIFKKLCWCPQCQFPEPWLSSGSVIQQH